MEKAGEKGNIPIIPKVLREHSEYLDKVAIEVMRSYIDNKPPENYKQNISIAQISYNQALAMLDAKLNIESLRRGTKALEKFVRNDRKKTNPNKDT